MWHELAKLDDLRPGGLKYAKAGAREVCICRVSDDEVYAVSRRCGHQNAPLDQGALDGWVLTCPLHNAQFDVRSGQNLSWAIDHYYGPDPLPEPVERFFALETRMSWKTRIYDLDSYPTRIKDGAIEVDVPET